MHIWFPKTFWLLTRLRKTVPSDLQKFAGIPITHANPALFSPKWRFLCWKSFMIKYEPELLAWVILLNRQLVSFTSWYFMLNCPPDIHQNGLQRQPYIYLTPLSGLIVSMHNGVGEAAANFLVFNARSIFVSNCVSISLSAFVVLVQSSDGKWIITMIWPGHSLPCNASWSPSNSWIILTTKKQR